MSASDNNACNVSIKSAIGNVIAIFLVSRISIFLIGYMSSLIILKDKFYPNLQNQNLLDLFFRWDSGWYLSIAQNGYEFVSGQESRAGFFPLYPLLVKTFSYLFVDIRLTGFIISNLALLFAATYLYRLMLVETKDDSIASKTVLFMLISPLSFFFSIFYTEGLFIFLIIAACYYARTRQWLFAALAGFFATLTKILGILILIPIAIEYFEFDFKSIKTNLYKLRNVQKDFLYLLIVPLALLFYMLYLQFEVGDALAFVHAQSAWNRKFVLFIKTWANIDNFAPFYRHVYKASIIIAVVSLGYLIYKRMRLSYIVYAIVFLFMILSSNNAECLPRYISAIFPIYMGMGMISERGVAWYQSMALFFCLFLCLFIVLFVNGYWFTG